MENRSPQPSVPSEWRKDEKRASVLLLETEDRWQVMSGPPKMGAEPEEVTMGSQETLAGPPPTLHRWDPAQTGLHPRSETSVTINISLLCGLRR